MPAPLKWNSPGRRWSPLLKWNGLIPTAITMKIKAIIDFTSYTAAELAPVAQTIHDKMLANAATFPAPPVGMAALASLLATYDQKLAARASRASVDVLAFNLARHDLEGALHDLGVYVNFVAKGDAMIVEKSGFPSYGSAQPGPAGPPAQPRDLRLRNGDVSQSIIGRCKPDRPNSMNIVQTNPGDPNNEAGWKYVMTFPGGKFTITGLPVGSTQWARVATVGPGGVVGAWSDPSKIVIT